MHRLTGHAYYYPITTRSLIKVSFSDVPSRPAILGVYSLTLRHRLPNYSRTILLSICYEGYFARMQIKPANDTKDKSMRQRY